ncbi:TIGR01906 family membrane protein [Carnobacterium funditum]|uniref:TIGR01906 family membrane protein n=1 Tax=Carnobacterium funditum TaxID=2752 RepID=UPI000A00F0D1|nr:TIGR01906 family membrane protein [Carnobacterium funditum]
MKSKAIYLLGFICLFFFVLSVSIAITISFMPLYVFDIEYLNIANRIEMTKEILLKNYSILLNYLTIPWITELEMPNFPSSKKGLFHFSEVKKLFLLDYIILLFSGIGSFLFLSYLKKRSIIWKISRFFRWGSLITPLLIITLFVNFDTLFVLFHKVSFNNDAWLFNASTDPIILALPEVFFMHSFILAFGLFEVFFIIGYLISKRAGLQQK